MSTVLAPIQSLHTRDLEVWRLTTGSHLAIAPRRNSVAVAVPVASGAFVVDPETGAGSLTIALAVPGGGAVRGVATSGPRDGHGLALWTVHGTLEVAARPTTIVLTLRDHGVIRSRTTWWWLSGTGDEQPCGRRSQYGSRLVADLLLAP